MELNEARVLLIESDPPTNSALELVLRMAGFHVYTTDLGEEGAEFAVEFDYHLIICASHMVDITGLEVLRHLGDAGVTTPVIILSQDARGEAERASLEHGAAAYFTKPVRMQALVDKARECADMRGFFWPLDTWR